MDEFDKDKIDSQDNTPIDGQLGLEDLYYQLSMQQPPEPVVDHTPIDGQMSFDDLTTKNHNINNDNVEPVTVEQTDDDNDKTSLEVQPVDNQPDNDTEQSNTFDDDFFKQFDNHTEGAESVLFEQVNKVDPNKKWQKDWLEGQNQQEETFEQFIDSQLPKQEPELVEKHYETPEEIQAIKQERKIQILDTNTYDLNELQQNLQDDTNQQSYQEQFSQDDQIVEDIEILQNDQLEQQEQNTQTYLQPTTKVNLKYKGKTILDDYENNDLEQLDLEQQNSQPEQDVEIEQEEVSIELSVEEVEDQEELDNEQSAPNKVEKSTPKPQPTAHSSDGEVTKGLLIKNLDEVLHESMIPYSEHVILDRALPRVEDGLKPVQRRILYSMLELGVTPDKPYRKSARIVGDCMGKYHPHGDSSVYDAMVRMAQPYNINGVLVDGHGNFGSIDGDKAAAMRYTEARLAPLAMELLRDLEKDTVKWSFNFDDTLKEPDVLPGRFPNLLVNGTSGIAVGLATNIPPHNLGECIDGVVAYIDNPKITLKEMMKIIKGPDFPTGGYILPNSELEQAYLTGKGRVYMRAKMHIEGGGTDKRSIVITEIPYQVNKASLLQKIATLRDEGKNVLSGVSEIRDESDRNGIRAVIKVKKDANIKNITDYLLKYTDLQCTFGINMVAIADGKPKQLSLLEIISYYVNYQRDVILRRSRFELEQAKEREHILSGLLIAIKNIDAVIKIIKTSQNTTQAKQRLREKFALSERQAQAILDMRLARLTNLEVNKLELEIKALKQLIEKLTAIVNSKKLQLDLVKTEMLAIKRQYKAERKTVVMKSSDSLELPADNDKKQVLDVYIAYNALDNIKVVNRKYFSSVQKEFKENSTLSEVHNILVKSDTEKTAMIFTDLGNCYRVPVEQLPETRFKDKGQPVSSVIKGFIKGEKIVAIFSIDEQMPKGNLIFLTKHGMIKKTAATEYNVSKANFQAIKLKDDDKVINISFEQKDTSLLFVTAGGMILNADKSDVPLQGRISGGVKGINLNDKDYCISATQVSDEGEVVIMTDRGYVKRTLISQIEKMARYRKGVKIYSLNDKDLGQSLVFADYVKQSFIIVAKTDKDDYLSRNTDLIPIEARTGKGKLIEKSRTAPHITHAYKYLTE